MFSLSKLKNGLAVDLFSAVSINTVEEVQRIISLQLTVTSVNNGSDEILTIDGSDVALTNDNSVVTALKMAITLCTPRPVIQVIARLRAMKAGCPDWWKVTCACS